MTTEKPLLVGCLTFSNVLVGKSGFPTDYFERNHPLVVKYTKELKDSNQELKAIITELMDFVCKVTHEETYCSVEADELRSKYYEFIEGVNNL